jgi:hypothetical protein
MKEQLQIFAAPVGTLFLLAFMPESGVTRWVCSIHAALLVLYSILLVEALIFNRHLRWGSFSMVVVGAFVLVYCGIITLMWLHGLMWQACAASTYAIASCAVVLEAKLRK